MYSLMEKDIIDTKQTISVSTTAGKKKKKSIQNCIKTFQVILEQLSPKANVRDHWGGILSLQKYSNSTFSLHIFFFFLFVSSPCHFYIHIHWCFSPTIYKRPDPSVVINSKATAKAIFTSIWYSLYLIFICCHFQQAVFYFFPLAFFCSLLSTSSSDLKRKSKIESH